MSPPFSAFNNIYCVGATRLTKWENHQTQLSFNNSLILKRFLFEAFDCYVALLFYLAFGERNIDKLRSELVSVFNIDTIRRLALECLQKWNRKQRDPTASSKKTDAPQVATHYTPLADQAELEEYEQFDEYVLVFPVFSFVLH
jgi:anoctamin-10